MSSILWSDYNILAKVSSRREWLYHFKGDEIATARRELSISNRPHVKNMLKHFKCLALVKY